MSGQRLPKLTIHNEIVNIQNPKIRAFIIAIVPVMEKLMLSFYDQPAQLSDRIEYANSLLKSGLNATSVILLTGERWLVRLLPN